MKKLKDILSEAYAWERKAGKPLPTLAEVQAEYLRNEAANDAKAKVAKLEKEIADLKHQYYSDKNLTAEKSQKLRKQLGEKGRELKRAKREDKTGSAGYKKPERWQDNDGDGIWYEPGDDVKENANKGASFQVRFAKYSDDALRDMIVTLRRFDGTKDDIRELEQELARRKQDKGKVNESTHYLQEDDDEIINDSNVIDLRDTDLMTTEPEFSNVSADKPTVVIFFRPEDNDDDQLKLKTYVQAFNTFNSANPDSENYLILHSILGMSDEASNIMTLGFPIDITSAQMYFIFNPTNTKSLTFDQDLELEDSTSNAYKVLPERVCRPGATCDQWFNSNANRIKQYIQPETDDINEYGDDETHAVGFNATGVETYDAAYDTPKDAMTESFWNRVNGNLRGHDWILENRKNQLNETAVLDNIVIKKKSDSTVRVYNKQTNKAAVYKLEYEIGSSFEPINKMIGRSRFDLTFDEISNKPNLSIEADLPVIKMVNYTIEFDRMQTNKIKQALEKNQNISIKWNMLRIIFTKQ